PAQSQSSPTTSKDRVLPIAGDRAQAPKQTTRVWTRDERLENFAEMLLERHIYKQEFGSIAVVPHLKTVGERAENPQFRKNFDWDSDLDRVLMVRSYVDHQLGLKPPSEVIVSFQPGREVIDGTGVCGPLPLKFMEAYWEISKEQGDPPMAKLGRLDTPEVKKELVEEYKSVISHATDKNNMDRSFWDRSRNQSHF
ncbi:MAG TPA: hypothetical protein VMG10_12330, partial [Gemmataceae bacterium]|nr:hypothetical protein [Gemmataceae bacterium]